MGVQGSRQDKNQTTCHAARKCPSCENQAMYETHPISLSPPGSSRLWRYANSPVSSVLGSVALYFSRSDLLGDPYEGLLSAIDREAYEAVIREVFSAEPDSSHVAKVRAMEAEVETKTLRGAYISCWHKSEVEQAAMWRMYGEEHGIAIRTTFDDLVGSLSDPQPIYAGEVRYIDYRREATRNLELGRNAFSPFTCKRQSFASDQEVRLVITRNQWAAYDGR